MYDKGTCEGCTKLKQVFSTPNFIRTFVTTCIAFQLLVNGESNLIKVRNIQYIDLLLSFLLTVSCFLNRLIHSRSTTNRYNSTWSFWIFRTCQTFRIECFTKIFKKTLYLDRDV